MNKEVGQRLYQQVMDIWVNPEIEKRRKIGKINDNFTLSKIQIVLSLDQRKNKVRLNEQVKAIVKSKINKPIKKGDSVYESDIDSIENIELTNKDSNCAHITLLFFKNNWTISFDFRYNKERIKEHIAASKEFYEAAKFNLDNNLLRPFFENAFASAELSAKGILLMLPDKKILFGRDHKDRLSKFENWAKLGNVKSEFNSTLSRLSSLRDSARYIHSDAYKKENPQIILNTLKEMINFAEEVIN